ncbi:MAG TPA: glycosyl hydrolase family 28-related protein [Candidatus Hydrogenedentes bacterium]|nr:glycosyl hydrolase family 28-related protein [Candidatus Hydrogenedentota bacterium]HPG69598.1 glycosyl hydrolase family 28-related protein [Candidatus Hydrogenedentota bacterium]
MRIPGIALYLVGACLVYAEAACVRSTLYPVDWTPAFEDETGRFLHDFSYAGYHNGEMPLPPNSPGTRFDVVTGFGADSTGASDSTASIQAAIDAGESAGGGVVYLPPGLYRCDDILTVTGSGVVIQGAGPTESRIYFTRSASMEGRAHISFIGSVHTSTQVLLAEDGANRAFSVAVSDATGLAVGDEVRVGWFITPEFVAEHGMTEYWQAFNGTWRPIFRREITAIDTASTPTRVYFDVPLRYPCKVRDGASLRVETGYLGEVGIESLGISTAVDYEAAWEQARTHAIQYSGVKDSWIRNVATFPSSVEDSRGYHLQSGGLRIVGSKRVTVAGCDFEKAQNRGDGGAGYLFEITESNEILTRDCVGRDGRHNFIQNWGFGTTGCVWLRCVSSGGMSFWSISFPIGYPSYCEFHHSLAMACLIDSCTLDDGWYGGNRRDESSGAGHTVTQSVFWNNCGNGQIRSFQFGEGYIIGSKGLAVYTHITSTSYSNSIGTEPEDFVDLEDVTADLQPQSLYEDQFERRHGRLVAGETEDPYIDGPTLVQAGEPTCLRVDTSCVHIVGEATYSWQKNGRPLEEKSEAILELPRPEPEDSGEYIAIVGDEAKALHPTPPFTLTVVAPPETPIRAGWLMVLLFPALHAARATRRHR